MFREGYFEGIGLTVRLVLGVLVPLVATNSCSVEISLLFRGRMLAEVAVADSILEGELSE